MNKLAVYLTLALPLTFAAVPASAKSPSSDGVKSHKAMKHSGHKLAKHRSHKFAMHKTKSKAAPTTTGMSPAQDPIKKSMDDPKAYGKPDKH